MATRTVSVKLQAEIGQYLAGMSQASAATMRLGESATSSTKQARGGFDVAGKGALLLGGAVVAGLGAAVAKSMDFEKSMSAVGAATMATGGTLADLRQAAMEAGAATQYSATEAADAITEMAKAGVSAKDIMGGGLKGALALAAAGEIDVAEAAGIASTAMTQFGLSGKDLPHVADLLAAGAGKAMGSVDDLGMALNQAGLIASAAGMSIEETTGTLAAFASAGLLGSDAGTSMKTMLQRLQAPSSQAAALMEQLGINVYDANGNMLGMSGIAGQLKGAMGGLTQEQRNSALAVIFGSDAVRAANVLYKQGAEGIAEWTAKVSDQGYAAEQAAKLNDNLAGDIERLGGAFDTLLISLGEGAQGPLRDVVQALTAMLDVASGIIGFWQSLPGPVQTAVVALAAVAALKGPVGSALDAIALKALYMGNTFSGLSLGMGGLKSAAGGLVGMFGGPWGVALAAGAVMVSSFTSSLASAEAGTDRWTKALIEGGAAARKAREDYDNGDYFLRSLDEWTGLAPSLEDAEKAARDYFDSLSPLEQAQAKVSEWTNTLKDRLSELGPTNADTATAQERLAYWTEILGDRQGKEAAATAQVNTVMGEAGAATRDFAQEAEDADKAVSGLQAAIDELSGKTVTLLEAQFAMEDAIAAATGALDGMAGSTLNAAGGLNAQSEAGRAAGAVLFDIRDKGDRYIATLKQQGASTAEVAAADANLRNSFVQSARTMNISEAAANALADQILGIPSQRMTRVTADTSQAEAAIAALSRTRYVTIVANTVAGSTARNVAVADLARQLNRAEGGIVHAFAGGGFMDGGTATIVPPNTFRVIGDRVTDDEAYIPINSDPRSHEILRQTASRMGYGTGRERSGGYGGGGGQDVGQLAETLAAILARRPTVGTVVTQRDQTGSEIADRLAFLARVS